MEKLARASVIRFRHEIHETEFSAERVLESMGEAVVAIDTEGRIQYLNEAARRQIALGLLPEAEELGSDLLLQVSAMAPRRGGERQRLQDPCQGVTGFFSSGGDHRPITFMAHPMLGHRGQSAGFVVRLQTQGEGSSVLRNLLHDATHDELTGLVNRRELISRLRRLVHRLRHTEQHALFFMDLDKFKQINDTCGHRAGDEALKRVAVLLRSHVRNRDTLGRLGGDEFVLLMEHCPEEKAVHTAHVLAAAVREQAFAWGGKTFHCGLSIGMVPLMGRKGDAESLLAEAEAACYEAKRSKGAKPAVFRRRLGILHGGVF